MPVTISIILDWSQSDTGSLTKVERNKKALGRIQKKIMHARSTLDWSQSNTISCCCFSSHARLKQQLAYKIHIIQYTTHSL